MNFFLQEEEKQRISQCRYNNSLCYASSKKELLGVHVFLMSGGYFKCNWILKFSVFLLQSRGTEKRRLMQGLTALVIFCLVPRHLSR